MKKLVALLGTMLSVTALSGATQDVTKIASEASEKGVVNDETTDTVQLREVTVTSEIGTLKQEAGKYIYLPGGMALKTANAIETLALSPMIIHENNSLRIFSKEQPAIIYINGKLPKEGQEATIAMLRSVPPANIKRIEIISQPGASVGAEERDKGIINVEIAAPDNGMVGNVYSANDLQNGRFSPMSESLYLGFQKDKFHASLSARYSGFNMLHDINSAYNYAESGKTVFSRERDSNFSNHGYLNLSAEYYFTPKFRVGVTLATGLYENHRHQDTYSSIVEADGTETGSVSKVRSVSPFRFTAYAAKVHAIKILDDRNSYLDLTLSAQNSPTIKSARTSDFPDYHSVEKEEMKGHSVAGVLKFLKNFAAGARLDAGTSVSAVQQSSSKNALPEYLYDFEWHGTTFPVYAEYSQTFSSGLSLNLGVRSEYKRIRTLHTYERSASTSKFFNFLPAASVSYPLPGFVKGIGLSYSHTATTPQPTLLDPYEEWISPNLMRRGNPDLKSSHSDKVTISASFKGNLTVELYYNYSGRLSYNTNEAVGDVTVMSYATGGFGEDIFLQPSFRKDIFPFWNLFASASFGYSRAKIRSNPEAGYHEWTGNLYLSNTFEIPRAKGFFIEFSYSFRPAYRGVMSSYRTSNFASIEFRKKFSPLTSLSFGINNLFCSRSGRYNAYYSSPEYNYTIKETTMPLSFSLTFTHTFGNTRAKGAQIR